MVCSLYREMQSMRQLNMLTMSFLFVCLVYAGSGAGEGEERNCWLIRSGGYAWVRACMIGHTFVR